MIERILNLIKSLNLSPSQFADEIGVQKSGISHLISGRNKPSLEFVQKILSKYPDINPEWLLSGKGSMTTDGNIQPVTPVIKEPASGVRNEPEVADYNKTKRKKIPEPEGKKVEKITWFFTDKTFREYYPE